jgi:four helix bundle protein
MKCMDAALSATAERPFDLKLRTRDFALRIITLFRKLPRSEEARIIGKQILRSGTSIGANYRAACRSRSRAEFIAKMGIVLEEADETIFWLELLLYAGVFPKSKIESLLQEANELTSIFVSSLRTSKGLQAGRTSSAF